MSDGALAALIRDMIAARGPMTIADYMELALQHPEHGYYRHGDPLGRAGDFITAPEISQMFGEMVGAWCAEMWRTMGTPKAFALVELGPGRGTLAKDALRATRKIAGFHDAMDLVFLESSKTLRDAQRDALADHAPRYAESLADCPAVPTIFIANEFFDALPIRQFEKGFQGWCERLVGLREERLTFVLSAPDPAYALMIPEGKRDARPGAIHEVCLPALQIARDISRHISRHGGAALAIDYGATEAASVSTLQAVSRHSRADALESPGNVDLTAHVDFGMLAAVAKKEGLAAQGVIPQGEFLEAMGISLRAAQLKQRATPDQARDIDSALERLTGPAHMGALFKALAIIPQGVRDVPGFGG